MVVFVWVGIWNCGEVLASVTCGKLDSRYFNGTEAFESRQLSTASFFPF